MLKPTDQFHGSDLEKVEKLYKIKREDILPFASNVNPLGMSPLMKQALIDQMDVIQDYPERDYQKLRDAISTYTGVMSQNILPGNGTTELIETFISTVKPKKTIVVEPTYSEYKHSLKEAGSEVEDFVLPEAEDFQLNLDALMGKITSDVDMVILCNPNNPTSTCLTTEQIKTLTEHCKTTTTFLMVDETYVEFVRHVDQISAISLVNDYNNLIVLRGVSKFFAAPGLRLGYACCSNTKLVRYINKHANPWSINSVAALAGTVMFTDEKYIQQTRDQILLEQSLVCTALRSRKTIKVYQPTTNFVLIKIEKEDLTAAKVFDYCMKRGYMIRDCSNFIGLGEKFIRFCFLNPEDDDKLVNTLLEIL